MAVVVEAKTELEAIENAKNQLHTEKIIYKSELIKGKLFKASTYKVVATSYDELISDVKDFLKQMVEPLGVTIENFESSVRDDAIYVVMYSDNNSILIGYEGRTLKALETLVRTKLFNEWNEGIKVVLDVSNYKEKRQAALERLAVKTAREVQKTHFEIHMDNMNSYERRIIHNRLTKFKNISSNSEGEEPNRHIVVRYEAKKNKEEVDE